MAAKKQAPGLTRAKLDRFITIRNKSAFASNMQFHIDASHAGIEIDDLGMALPLWGEGGEKVGYRWDTEFGQLQERPAERPRYRLVDRETLQPLAKRA